MSGWSRGVQASHCYRLRCASCGKMRARKKHGVWRDPVTGILSCLFCYQNQTPKGEPS